MRIPVFVSCPTELNSAQESARAIILKQLDRNGLEARALGRSDYPIEFPLKEVFVLATHCSGGLVLGFEQLWVESGQVKRRAAGKETRIDKPFALPTPWNHVEAGILFSLGIPLLVFRESSVSGGVFDSGVTDVFVHEMPMGRLSIEKRRGLTEVFLKWQSKVRAHYYGE